MGGRGHRRWQSALGVGVGVLLAPGGAVADCPLELVPEGASDAWTSAARAATGRLATAASHDCGSVEVAVRPSGGALVTFITTDGRRAVRALMSPEELGPALDALLVTLPPEPAQPEPAPVTPPSTEPPRTPPAPLDTNLNTSKGAAPTAGAATPAEVHFHVGASAGVRFGFGGAYVTPAISLRPSGTFGAWELTGAVEYDPSYTYLPGGLPAGFKLWSFIAGLQVGRREAIGNVALGYGLGLGVASIREEVNDPDGTAKVADFGQPRASLYGRVIFPRRSSFRGTLDLGLDAALGSVKKRATLRNDLPDLPRWGVLLAVGVETSAL